MKFIAVVTWINICTLPKQFNFTLSCHEFTMYNRKFFICLVVPMDFLSLSQDNDESKGFQFQSQPLKITTKRQKLFVYVSPMTSISSHTRSNTVRSWSPDTTWIVCLVKTCHFIKFMVCATTGIDLMWYYGDKLLKHISWGDSCSERLPTIPIILAIHKHTTVVCIWWSLSQLTTTFLSFHII